MSYLGLFPGIRQARGSLHLIAPGDEIRPKLEEPTPEPKKERKPRARKAATTAGEVAQPKKKRSKSGGADASQLELTPTALSPQEPKTNSLDTAVPPDSNRHSSYEDALTAEDLEMQGPFAYDDLPFEALSTTYPNEPRVPAVATAKITPPPALSAHPTVELNPEKFIWYGDL